MSAAKEIKRDIEMAMVGFNQAIVNGNTSTARKMASLSKADHHGRIRSGIRCWRIAGSEPERHRCPCAD